jgi:hypothetical protein
MAASSKAWQVRQNLRLRARRKQGVRAKSRRMRCIAAA